MLPCAVGGREARQGTNTVLVESWAKGFNALSDRRQSALTIVTRGRDAGRRERSGGCASSGLGLLPICGVEHAAVALERGIDLLRATPDHARREVMVVCGHCATVARVQPDRAASDAAALPTQQDEPPTDPPDRRRVTEVAAGAP